MRDLLDRLLGYTIEVHINGSIMKGELCIDEDSFKELFYLQLKNGKFYFNLSVISGINTLEEKKISLSY